ncbi:DUF2332 domain-containing protein [Amaricoccus macauensis]|uniref:DUF2332 domain-containing protein n=1 Tax=Amaricoccus macauensis TaxID=57001 RepID=UPI003C7DDBBA
MTARQAFIVQAESCDRLGSPFTARVCRIVAERLEADSDVARRILAWKGDPSKRSDALPLRFTAALHGLVLEERAPELAALYPPNHENITDDALWDAICGTIDRFPRYILNRLSWPPQTNECMRSAALCPGFLTIADRIGLPLVTSELGASAGLNLIWDRYSYRFGDAEWGPKTAPVTIAPEWSGPPPPLVDAKVLERAGCDHVPTDLREPPDRLRMQSYIWADQVERMERINAAMDLTRDTGIQIITRDALDWLTDRLALRLQGSVHVVYHSVFWQYLNRFAKVSAVELLSEAGNRATPEAPLAWLRFEGDGRDPGGAILLTLWPGGETHRLGRADYHGRWVDWTGWE